MKKNRWVFMGAPVLALIFALALTACDHGGGSSYISGDMTGTWTESYGGSGGTLTVVRTGGTSISSSGEWRISYPGSFFDEKGTYTMRGTTAYLYGDSDVIPIGTAGLVNSTTLVVTLNAYSGNAGTSTFTRPGSSSSSSGFIGTWTGNIGIPAMIEFNSNTWSISSASFNEFGNYAVIGYTATLTNHTGYADIGTATLITGTNTIQVTLYTGSYAGGLYTFTRISP